MHLPRIQKLLSRALCSQFTRVLASARIRSASSRDHADARQPAFALAPASSVLFHDSVQPEVTDGPGKRARPLIRSRASVAKVEVRSISPVVREMK